MTRRPTKPPATEDAGYIEAKACLKRLRIPRMRQSNSEFAELWRTVRARKPATIMEVGARDGCSLYMLAQAMPGPGRVVGIELALSITSRWCGDEWGELHTEHIPVEVAHAARPPGLTTVAEALRAEGHEVLIIDGNSHDSSIAAEAQAFIGADGAGTIFLDGDDSFVGSRLDWNMYAPMARPGGVVAMHDIQTRWLGGPDHRRRFGVRFLWADLTKIHRTRQWATRWNEKGIGAVLVPRQIEHHWWEI